MLLRLYSICWQRQKRQTTEVENMARLKQHSKKKKWPLYLGVAITLLLLIGVGGYFAKDKLFKNYGTIDTERAAETKTAQQNLRAYFLDDNGEISFKDTVASDSSSMEKSIRHYIKTYFYGSPILTATSYEDDEGKHVRLSIDNLNFLNYYIKHPNVSKTYPAFSVKGDVEDKLPMEIQKRIAQAIDQTIKESYGVSYVHWTINNQLQANDGILFGEMPEKSRQTLEGVDYQANYFVDPDPSLLNSSEIVVENEIDSKMAELLEKYPNGVIPPEELPYE